MGGTGQEGQREVGGGGGDFACALHVLASLDLAFGASALPLLPPPTPCILHVSERPLPPPPPHPAHTHRDMASPGMSMCASHTRGGPSTPSSYSTANTRPPAARMRRCSSGRSGLWSSDTATASSCPASRLQPPPLLAVPPPPPPPLPLPPPPCAPRPPPPPPPPVGRRRRARMHRESPMFATVSVVCRTTAAMPVVPENSESTLGSAEWVRGRGGGGLVAAQCHVHHL